MLHTTPHLDGHQDVDELQGALPVVVVESFGYRHLAGDLAAGDALVVDVRERLRDPVRDPALRAMTGLDAPVRARVLATSGAEQLVNDITAQAAALHTARGALGTAGPVRVRIGCAGGRHRSVVLADEVTAQLAARGYSARAVHRHIDRPVIGRDKATCPFCAIINHGPSWPSAGQPGEVVREWPGALAIRPRRPVTPGHLLVVPRAHVVDAGEDPGITATTVAAAAELAAELDAANLITSKGTAATQTVPHLHIHVVPRHTGDGLALPWT